jgi:hypothetical protein
MVIAALTMGIAIVGSATIFASAQSLSSLETTFQDRTGILSSSTDPITHWVAQSST